MNNKEMSFEEMVKISEEEWEETKKIIKHPLIKKLMGKREEIYNEQKKGHSITWDYKSLPDIVKENLPILISWWVKQAQMDLITELIHGRPGYMNQGIIIKYLKSIGDMGS